VQTKRTDPQLFSPKAQTGRSFDALMKAALLVKPKGPKKASRPRKVKKK
jgi:hypothetical protein